MNYLALNLKKIRSVNQLSQAKFAEILDVTRASISSYEEGRANPKQELLIKIAKTYKLSIDLLLNKQLTVNDIIGINKLTPETARINPQQKSIPLVTTHSISDYFQNKNHTRLKTFSLPFEFDCHIAFEYKPNWFLLCSQEKRIKSRIIFLSKEGLTFNQQSDSNPYYIVGEIRLDHCSEHSNLTLAIDRLHQEIDRL